MGHAAQRGHKRRLDRQLGTDVVGAGGRVLKLVSAALVTDQLTVQHAHKAIFVLSYVLAYFLLRVAELCDDRLNYLFVERLFRLPNLGRHPVVLLDNWLCGVASNVRHQVPSRA